MKILKPIIVLLILSSFRSNTPGQKGESTESADTIISYWDEQRKGTNHFNQIPSEQWFDAAKKANIEFVRLVFEKWDGEQRDFILGDADAYQGIVEGDFQKLLHFLDYANEMNIKIVITPISLPGDRWIQSNNDQKDGRLWLNWSSSKWLAW